MSRWLARAGSPPRTVVQFPVSGWSGNDSGAPRPRLGATSDEELALRSHDNGANPRARQPARRPLPLSVRFAVLKRDRFTCVYCGKSPPAVAIEVDHVDPVALGGTDDVGNLVTSCRDCNGGKGARPLDRATSTARPVKPPRAAETKADTFGAEAARRLLAQPPRGASVVLVGPALVYGDDELLSLIAVCGVPNGEHLNTRVDLGVLVADVLDDQLAAAADVVWHIRRAGEITLREGRALRAALIRELARAGKRVEDCASERILTDAYVRVFPGERSRKLRAEFEAEQGGAANG
jgi:hypothetical protein